MPPRGRCYRRSEPDLAHQMREASRVGHAPVEFDAYTLRRHTRDNLEHSRCLSQEVLQTAARVFARRPRERNRHVTVLVRKSRTSGRDKGLDLIPLLFEMVLWSAKYDSRSEAKRIVRLVDLIRKDNRRISREVMEKVRRGEAIVAEYAG